LAITLRRWDLAVPLADAQAPRDRLVAASLRQQVQDVVLAARQRFAGKAVGNLGHHRIAEIALSAAHHAYGSDDLVAAG
jgi:hypothetical protein